MRVERSRRVPEDAGPGDQVWWTHSPWWGRQEGPGLWVLEMMCYVEGVAVGCCARSPICHPLPVAPGEPGQQQVLLASLCRTNALLHWCRPLSAPSRAGAETSSDLQDP